MNWNAVSAVSDLIAAFAVVVSLIYLAIQVRSGARDLRESNRDSVFHSVKEWNFVVMSDESLAWIFQEGCRNLDSLSDKERARYLHIMYSFFKVFESIYIQLLEGSVAKDVWEYNCYILYQYAVQPGAQNYWKSRQKVFDPRFCEIINSLESDTVQSLNSLRE